MDYSPFLLLFYAKSRLTFTGFMDSVAKVPCTQIQYYLLNLSCYLGLKKSPHPDSDDFLSGRFAPLLVGEGRVRSFVVIRNDLGNVAT